MSPAVFALAASVLALSANTPSLHVRADAGLGGVVRAGRWTPVRVGIDNDGPATNGNLVARWGSRTIRRRVVLAAGTRNTFELLLRTEEPRNVISIRVDNGAGEIAEVDAAATLAPFDAPFTLCVADGPATSPSDGCSAIEMSTSLPHSLRGFDAADEVVWGAGPLSRLDDGQRRALEGWRAYRTLEDQDALSTVPRPSGPERGIAWPHALRPIAFVFAAQSGALAAFAAIPLRRRRGARALALAVVATAALAGVEVAGRWGPASTPLLMHETVVTQLTPSLSLVSARGWIESPAASDAIVLRLTDASIDAASDDEQRLDESGYPVVDVPVGLGARRDVSIEGEIGSAALKISRRGVAVYITNLTEHALTSCRLPRGFYPERVDTLAAGATVEATVGADASGRALTCASADAPFEGRARGRPVRFEGATSITAFVPAADGGAL